MPNDVLARLSTALFVFLWATGFIAARLVAPVSDPLAFLLCRYGLAIVSLALFAWYAGAAWPRSWAGWRDGLLAGILIHGVYLGGVFWAVKHGLPAGVAALVAGLQPVLTGLLATPLLGEHVSAKRWAGILLGFAGAALVIAPRLSGSGAYDPFALASILVAVVSITLGTIWQKRTASKVDLRTNTCLQYLGAAAVTLPVVALTGEWHVDPTLEFWIGLIWAVFGISILGVAMLLMLIRRGAVAGVAALLYLVPPLAALMSYFLFGEALSAVQIAGMALASLGVAIASRA